jgi:hypothetical protein
VSSTFGGTQTPLAVGECCAVGELAVSCCIVVCYMFSTEDLYYSRGAHNITQTCYAARCNTISLSFVLSTWQLVEAVLWGAAEEAVCPGYICLVCNESFFLFV